MQTVPSWRYSTRMSEPKPIGRFTLTPPRIMILVLGVLAIAMIIGAIAGGVGNYQDLRDARDAALSSAAEAPSQP